MNLRTVFPLVVLLLLSACGGDTLPRPHGYFRFDLPSKEYRLFDSLSCPYSFEYPVYGEIKPYKAVGAEKYWFDLVFPQYRATVYLSYKPVKNNLATMLEDMRSLLYKHSGKADAIESQFYDNPEEGTSGFLYDVGGNAASSVQFYITDSTQHFLRGSLYFYATPNRDSLAPLIDFFREDVKHLMETVRFF